MENAGKHLAKMFRERIADYEHSTQCGRSDLRIADYEVINAHEARIMLEYAKERGTPKPTEIGKWVLATTHGAAHAVIATLKDHPELSAVTGIIQETLQPMSIKHVAKMMKAGVNRYRDTDKNLWRVEEGPGGEKFLVRASDVDLTSILEERKNRQRSGRYARVDLSMVHTAGTAELGVGDTVAYSEPGGGQMVKNGVIESISGDKVKIKGREGAMDRSYVVDIVEMSPARKKKENAMIVDFMTKWYYNGDKSLGNKMKMK
jgi:hypothetical protein